MDKFDFVSDKKYFVKADGQGKSTYLADCEQIMNVQYILSVHLERKWKERKNQGVRGVALHFCPINLTQRWEQQQNQTHRT